MMSTDGAFEMGFGVVDVVGMLEKESGDAEASLHFDYGEKGDLTLTYCFQALNGLAHFALVLVLIR